MRKMCVLERDRDREAGGVGKVTERDRVREGHRRKEVAGGRGPEYNWWGRRQVLGGRCPRLWEMQWLVWAQRQARRDAAETGQMFIWHLFVDFF